nr:FAD binding domain-containing protein [Kineosphaera limosa]
MLNGRAYELVDLDPDVTALDWIRRQGFTGAKEGCAEGECGACAVLVVKPAGPNTGPAGEAGGGGSVWTAVNSCLVPVAALAGQEVVTAEGLGSPDALHPVQREMAVRGGSQCGYCTPGFVCSMAAEYYRDGRCGDGAAAGPATAHTDSDASDQAADHEVGPNGFDLHALSGNLCRCTGYRPIRDAAYALVAPDGADELTQRTQQAAPPAHLERMTGPNGVFVRPGSLAEVLAILAEEPDAAIVAGSTDRGVEVNLRGLRSPLVVGIDRVPELRELRVDDDAYELGAALSLSEIERGLAGAIPVLDELFAQFASRLIRNSATLGGNLGTASPIGDSPPVLLALDARLVLAGPDGDREVALADYFTGYRQSVRRPGELIRSVRLPRPTPRLTAFHKIAKRRFDDISSVAVGYGLDIDDGVVRSAQIGLGGVAATPIRATATERALVGAPWTSETVQAAADIMAGEGTPMSDHRASSDYRSAMLRTSLLKFFTNNSVGNASVNKEATS